MVVYKIDRLSRSLADFAKLVEVFDRNNVTFVSVTQSFNTTTSMGRLTLNILLSFAQFEREVTAERIRDKVAASRKKGLWMGGVPPLRLSRREPQAGHRRRARRPRPLDLRPVRSRSAPPRSLRGRSALSASGRRAATGSTRSTSTACSATAAYIGEAVHKGESYPGEHDAIIDRETWDRVHAILHESPRKRAARTRADTPALLKGLLFGPDGTAFSPTHTRKGDRLYRYYVSQTVLKHGAGSCPVGRVPAGEIEAAVIDQLRVVFRQPEVVAGTWKAARAHADGVSEADARAALQQLDPLWDELFPAEQARIVTLLVERADIGTGGLNVRLRMDGLGGLAREMLSGSTRSSGMTRATAVPETVTIHVPFRIVKRGGRKEMQRPSDTQARGRPDDTLIKALARAFRWKSMLDNGAFATVADLAAQEGIAVSYLTRVLRLTQLAPDLVEAITRRTASTGPDASVAESADP